MAVPSTPRWCLPVVMLGLVAASCSSDLPSSDGGASTTAVASGLSTTTIPTPTSTTGVPSPTTTTTTSTTTTTTTSTTTSTTAASTTTSTTTIPATTTTSLPIVTVPPAPAPTSPPANEGSIYDVRPPSDLPAPPLPDGWVTQSLGSSVQGRDITALVRQVEAPTRSVLVVGGIHGNEPASPPTVRAFVDARFADDVAVWLVPELNPDGVAAGTRWNANGVDLNRNFSWDWRASDGGAGPLSEPESAAISSFIATTRPVIVIWVHQPYGYVSSIADTDRTFEAAWSVGSGLPTRSGVTQHGGGESWTYFEAGLPSMLIEIDTWAATGAVVDAQLAGFQSLLVQLGWDA